MAAGSFAQCSRIVIVEQQSSKTLRKEAIADDSVGFLDMRERTHRIRGGPSKMRYARAGFVPKRPLVGCHRSSAHDPGTLTGLRPTGRGERPHIALSSPAPRASERYQPSTGDNIANSCCPTHHHRPNCPLRVRCATTDAWTRGAVVSQACGGTWRVSNDAPKHFVRVAGLSSSIRPRIPKLRPHFPPLPLSTRRKARVFARPRRDPCTSLISAAGFILTARLGAGKTCRFLHVARTSTSRAKNISSSSQEAKSLILCRLGTFPNVPNTFLMSTRCAKGEPGARFWDQASVGHAARRRKKKLRPCAATSRLVVVAGTRQGYRRKRCKSPCERRRMILKITRFLLCLKETKPTFLRTPSHDTKHLKMSVYQFEQENIASIRQSHRPAVADLSGRTR
jgi:hypothetical protein